MTRKRYDDEKLKANMVALRKQGFSYRQIAQKLGCSTFKVYELLSPLEKPDARLRQAAQLAEQLGELEAKAKALEGRFANLDKRVAELGVLDDLKNQVSKLNAQLNQLNMRTFRLEENLKADIIQLHNKIQKLQNIVDTMGQNLPRLEVTFSHFVNDVKGDIRNLNFKFNVMHETFISKCQSYEDRLADIAKTIQWIYRSSMQKVEGKKACKYIDKEGYCRQIVWHDIIDRCRTKQVNGGQLLNVKDKPLICIACPFYKPK